MKTNRALQGILIFILILLISSCASTAPGVAFFSGDPRPDNLDPSIVNSNIFTNAPLPHIKALHYQAYQIPSNQFYSNYQINLVATKGRLTQYRTFEITPTKETLHGKCVGYGGMFSMEYIRQGSVPVNRPFYIKYRWTSISNLQGNIFPLGVGRKLEFDYTEQVNKTGNDANVAEEAHKGHIVYQVIGHQKGYDNGSLHLPGDVYIVRFSKSTGNGPLLPKNVYYFSTYLGWYVQATYYFDGKPMAVYKLSNWQTSLDLKKPE